MAAPSDPRIAIVAAPADTDAWAAYLRAPGTDAPERAARWFHRILRLGGPVDALALRRALLAAKGLHRTSLLAIDGPLRDDETTGIIGAAVHLGEAIGAAPGPRRYDSHAAWPDRLRAAVAVDPAVARLSEAAKLLRIRTYTMGALHRAGLIERACAFAIKTASFQIRVRRRVYGTRRYLTGSWTAHIGHLAMLAHLAHGARAGLFDGTPLAVWNERIGNRPLLERILTQIGGVEMVPANRSLAESHMSLIPELVGGRFLNHFEAYDHALRQAPPAGGTLLRPLAEDAAAIRGLLKAVGLPIDARVVTVHVRDTPPEVSPLGAIRNADIQRMLPALTALAAAGYAVIRLGNNRMRPLPPIAGVVDYAHSRHKTPATDLALAACSHFHIGGSSGMSLVPMLFGVPTLFADWYPVNLIPHGAANHVVLKGLADRSTGRLLDTVDDHRRLGALTDPGVLADAGVTLVGLTTQQLRQAIADFAQSVRLQHVSPVGEPSIFIPTDDGLRPVSREALRVF